jgi:hypothetical protein
MIHLKLLEKQKQANPKTNRREIIRIRAEINKIETKKTIQRINETTMGLDFEHMIKARAHKGGVRIGKKPKKLASLCCP